MKVAYYEGNTRFIRDNMKIMVQESDYSEADGRLDELKDASSYQVYLFSSNDGKIHGIFGFNQVAAALINNNDEYPDIKIQVPDLECEEKSYH